MTTPVIVGAAAVVQHTTAEEPGVDAASLMVDACRLAVARTGVPSLGEQVDLIVVPRGTWRYPDAGRLVAEAIGSPAATTLSAEVGVLQTTVLSAALDAVSEGRSEVALVVGGEALNRRRVAKRAGRRAAETQQDDGVRPDVVLRPPTDFLGADEALWGIDQPYLQYALIDSARRHRVGTDIGAARHELAELWAGFSAAATTNPTAWDPQPWSADDLLDESRPGNRMLAFPYTAKLVTQMYVDQAAALLVCGADVAERAGVNRSSWSYPALTVDCEMTVPLVERTDPGTCPQWSIVADTIGSELGMAPGAADHIDLYSCFPVAVTLQRDAFGLADRSDLTVTGGMTFGGGPFNNAAIQALARSCELVQGRPGQTALVTAVSGMLTKQGVVILGADPPAAPYHTIDVKDRAAVTLGRRSVVATYTGQATVEATTVVAPREAGHPHDAVVLLTTGDGRGTVGRSTERSFVDSVIAEDWVGRTVNVNEGAVSGPAVSASR